MVKEEYDYRLNYINLDCFLEYLFINFIDSGKDSADDVPKDDYRTGLNTGLFMDSSEILANPCFKYGMWFNTYADITYSRTNFFAKGKDNFLLLTLSPKAGLRIAYKAIALEPYYKLDYVRDLLNNDWNKETWGNNIKYGPGVRLSLGGLLQEKKPELWKNTSIFLYSEYLNVDYHSHVGEKSIGLTDYDFRAGINLWIPFGALKGTPGEGR